MSVTNPPVNTIRYVVVVHGIGEQRKNETVLPVINRFAEARRRRKPTGEAGQPLSLGLLSSYPHEKYGHWIELDGIPQDHAVTGLHPFLGRRLRHPQGENLRFVDLHWADVMQGHFKKVGQDLDPWSTSLLQRLRSREAPDWILEVIHSMRRGLIPTQKVLGLRLPGLSDTVFNRFLGDVQLYGEFAQTRGRAIRVFHDILAELEASHGRRGCPGTPRFTVIAHSLGSVLAFDALLFAHGARQAGGPRLDTGNPRFSLPGYGEDKDKYPSLDWIQHVDSLVTLGSPIDKYLVLWWLNYQHLEHTDWLDPGLAGLRSDGQPIRHYNYCDEQDPVGHELDVAYSAPAVQAVFGNEPAEQFVFTRYAAPGVAHVQYWQDSQLFARILDLAVDGKPESQARPVNWFRLATYFKALVVSYLALPVLGWLAATFTMLWAYNSDSWSARLPLALGSFGILALTLWLMKLVVQWRQVMRSKRQQKAEHLPEGERKQRSLAVGFVRTVITVLPVVWLYLLVAVICAAVPGEDATPGFVKPAADLIAAIPEALEGESFGQWHPEALQELTEEDNIAAYFAGLFVALVYALIVGLWNMIVFYKMKWKWSSNRMPMKLRFVEYLRSDPSAATPAPQTPVAPAARQGAGQGSSGQP